MTCAFTNLGVVKAIELKKFEGWGSNDKKINQKLYICLSNSISL